MNRIIHFLLPAIITMGMSGCTAYENKGMAGTAVDMPDKKPLAPALTNPTSSPVSNTHDRENIAPVASASRPEDVIVQIGDDLEVDVAEDHSFDGIYEVRLGGYIILPAVGRIQTLGLPLKEVEANITKTLEETQLAHATVKVNKLGETHGGRQH